ncbi:MAG: hypothetical protein U0105_00770 [Candidatus Obscuribacterales bacterium]
MVDDTASPDRVAALATKIEKESRFTRTLVVVTCVANLCVMFYMMHEMFVDLPIAILAKYQENLQIIYSQWKTYENLGAKSAAPAPAPAPATAAPAK